MRTQTLLTLLCSTALVACSSGDDDRTGDDTTIPPTDLTCPAPAVAGTYTVCDLKLDGGSNQPRFGDPVVVEAAIVTAGPYSILEDSMTNETTLGGFFVQDPQSTTELAGRYGGILVTYRPNDLQGTLPAVGDQIRITGNYRDFGQDGGARQKQVEATFVEPNGSGALPEAVVVDDPSSISTGGSRGPGLEGVLVKVNNVTADLVRDIPGAGGSSIFGAFRVTGGLIVSGEIFQYRAVEQEQFISITGVLRVGTAPFDSGIFMLTPTKRDDVVSLNPTPTITSVATLQDPNAPDRVEVCERTGNGTTGRCPRVAFDDVAVTAVGGYVSSGLRAMWVQDTTIATGRFAGVKVIYGEDDTTPNVGDRISLTGEAIEWFDGTQIQNAEWTGLGTTWTSSAAVVVTSTDIARNSDPRSSPYEGTLVRIENAMVTERCVEANGRDFGNWVVANEVFIGTAWSYEYNGGFGPSTAMCDMPAVDCSCAGMSRPDDMRMNGDTFSSITGVMNYAFDEMRLEPRSAADLVR